MKNMISSRALFVAGIFLLVFVLLVAKLFTIQIGKHEYFSLVADRQQNKPEVVKAERGLIKDANGEVLCYTENNISFYADRRMMTPIRVDSICSVFMRVFGKPKQYYKKLIDEGINNVCLEKKVLMDKALLLKKVVIEGLKSEQDFTRVYPYGSLASHVLGYVRNEKSELKGVEGIEKFYNKALTGTDGNCVYERDVLGRILSVDEKQTQNALSGNTLFLTINKTYQKIMEEELAKGIQKFGGESAVGIAMNPNNGEILALANSPDFDPANYDLFDDNARRDRAITDTYEPGSTMKPITMSILLDNNLVKENEVVNTENGRYIFKNVKITDDHKSGQLTAREIIEKSSNIGISKLSARIPDETFYKYLRNFGFSSLTTIDLPSEEEGSLKKPKDFTPISKAFMSFGYEVAVTPLQLVNAYCAIINGGTLWKPFIVKSIVDYSGKIVETNEPKKIRTIISKSASDKIKSMMVGVVENGTGKAAQLDNVLVGGKTGTSQRLVNNSYSAGHHNSSFIGFFPADNPKVVCLIVVNAPKVGQYGGLVSAPIFHDVAKRMIEADLSLVPEKKKIEREQNLIDILMADLKSDPKQKTVTYMDMSRKKVEGSKQRVSVTGNRSQMPNLLSQPMRDAIARLNDLGILGKVSGTGKVVWQSIEPGSNLTHGITCSIKCEPTSKKINVSVN